jgi:hypothetical protein
MCVFSGRMLHLPTYEEVKSLPRDPPPYSYVAGTTLPETRIGGTGSPPAEPASAASCPPYTETRWTSPPEYSENSTNVASSPPNYIAVGTPSSGSECGGYPLLPYPACLPPPQPFTSATAEEISNFCDQHFAETSSSSPSNTDSVWRESIVAQAGPSSTLVGLQTDMPSMGARQNQQQARQAADFQTIHRDTERDR